MVDQAVKEKVLKQFTKDEVIKLLQDAVRIPGHKDLPQHESDVAKFYFDYFREQGIKAELQDVGKGRLNVLAWIRGSGGGSSLMLNSHTDTKPPYNMEIEPYNPVIKDGKLYGRGSLDAKAQLTAFAFALLAIHRADIPLSGDLLFVGAAGEEWDSVGSRYIARYGPKTDMAIVGEPTNLDVCIAHKGGINVTLTVLGRSAHSSVPHLGVNAVAKMGKLIMAIEEELPKKLAVDTHPLLGVSTHSLGVISGGMQPTVVPDKCTLTLDIRTVSKRIEESVSQFFEEIINSIKAKDPDFHAEFSMRVRISPVDTKPDHPIVTALKRSILEVTGRDAKIVGAPYGTDAAHLVSSGITTVICGPGDIAYAHSPVEFVPIDEVVKAVEIFTLTVLEICK